MTNAIGALVILAGIGAFGLFLSWALRKEG